MKLILKLLGLLAVWSIVIGMIILVDPIIVRDVLIPGSYFPMIVALLIATWYSAVLILKKFWLSLLISLLLILAVVLSMMHLMYWFVALGIILLSAAICYIHFSR